MVVVAGVACLLDWFAEALGSTGNSEVGFGTGTEDSTEVAGCFDCAGGT